MKKISAILLTLLLLTSCGSTQSGTDDNPLFYTYETGEYQMDIPDTWEIITDFDSTYPNGLRAAFKNNIRDKTFVANVIVIHERNKETQTNQDISQQKLKDNSGTLINYKLDSQSQINLNVGNDSAGTFLNKFEGKNKTDGYMFDFMQTYLTQGQDAWIVTATYLTDEDSFVIERMEKMLKSFALK